MKKFIIASLMVMSFGAQAQVNNPFYDEVTGILTLPSVTVGGKKFKNVFVKFPKGVEVMSVSPEVVVEPPIIQEVRLSASELKVKYEQLKALVGTSGVNKIQFHQDIINIVGVVPKTDSFSSDPGINPVNPGSENYSILWYADDDKSNFFINVSDSKIVYVNGLFH